jgi:glycosyltransferase involved in cell wall biosynthesis
MRIAVIAPPYYRVPPKTYGGTERVINLLVEGLVERGYDVTLFATGDSQTRAKLRSIYAAPIGAGPLAWAPQARHGSLAFTEADQFDIIHNHTPVSGFLYSMFVETPTVHTIHYMDEQSSDLIFYRAWPGRSLIMVSQSQRRLLAHPEPVRVVHNGVDANRFTLCHEKDAYLLHIGRLSERKGTHLAVEVARRSGRRLILAGKIEDDQFYQRAIAPYVDGEQIEMRGSVGGQERIDLFQRACALLFPIQWEEPFGLVLAEAMACGTPVVAFGHGSVPELVRHGETGFIVNDVDAMCAALDDLPQIDPDTCRSHVLAHFSLERMIDGYEAVYRSILAQHHYL